MNFVYPTAAEMTEILPEIESLGRAGRVGLELFPVEKKQTFFVRWFQRDNPYGLMQFRGLDGQPPKVQRLGGQTYIYEPGVYGEYDLITERELLTRAAPMNLNIPIPITDLVMDANRQLTGRLYDRMEANAWTTCATGTLSIPFVGPSGVQNFYQQTFNIQTYAAPVPWSSSTTATPLLNFQAAQQLGVGHGTDFGAGATAYMNQYTANLLINNQNPDDLFGKRDNFGATLNNLPGIISYFQGQNLSKLVVYDRGYQISPIAGPETLPSTQYQKFIPNHIVIIIGARPGNAPVGHWQQTIQSMSPTGDSGPGSYSFVKDYAQGINAPKEVPPRIEVHQGFNGGVAIEYPNSIVAMTV